MAITTDYSDYQEAGGVRFPRTITQIGGPSGDVTLRVTSIDMNTGLKSENFVTNLPERVVPEHKEPIEENPMETPPQDE
ncbi:MAG: hypothetical protein IPJ85_09745 [Flavobacteriales bacterium]|nr:hypothetical protein [Flavobacteriales bacterium]